MMDILCNTLCFFNPKYYNKDYLLIANGFKKDIETFIKSLKLDDDIQFLGFLLRIFEILENDSGLRSNLIQFRNELELYKTSKEMNETRQRLIELSIQTITLIHYGTLYCTSRIKFDMRASSLKEEYQLFKEWIKSNKSTVSLSSIEKFYVSYLYKIPKLMKIKRGFKKSDSKSRPSLSTQN